MKTSYLYLSRKAVAILRKLELLPKYSYTTYYSWDYNLSDGTILLIYYVASSGDRRFNIVDRNYNPIFNTDSIKKIVQYLKTGPIEQDLRELEQAYLETNEHLEQ